MNATFLCTRFTSGLTQALRLKSDSLTEAQRSLQSAQTDRASAEERLRSLQRAVALLETEKRDAERQAVRLEKDKAALRNTLDKVRRRRSVCTVSDRREFTVCVCVVRWSARS